MKFLCFDCKHFWHGVPAKCEAFPKGIPKEIFLGSNDHEKPTKEQDNDIVFEEKKRD